MQWNIEKRVLKREGHVMRMKDKSMTKVAVFGWYKKLEGVSKAPGKKRKTVLDGWEGMSEGVWVGGLVASIVGGW